MNSVQLSDFFLPFETQLKEIVCEMVKMSDATCFYVWGTPNRNHQRIRSNIKLNEINFFIMWQSPFCRRNYPQNGKMSSYRHHLAFACVKYHKKTPAKLNWSFFMWMICLCFPQVTSTYEKSSAKWIIVQLRTLLVSSFKKSFIEILCCINQEIAKQKKLQRGHLRIVMNHCITK